jgi:hypothetical protein
MAWHGLIGALRQQMKLDGKGAKEIDRYASRQNLGVGGIFEFLYLFCTRKKEEIVIISS